MKNEIIYTTIAILILLGICSNAWYYTDFRTTVGNRIFTVYIAFALLAFAGVIYLIGLEFSGAVKILTVAGTLIFNILITNKLYKKGKAQQSNQGDGE